MGELYGSGVIPQEVVQNVFAEAQQVLRERIYRAGGPTPDVREIGQFLDSIRERIYQKAAAAPRPAAVPREAPAQDEPGDSHSAYLAYRSNVAAHRGSPTT